MLLPSTEHKFRVRSVRGNEVSEWSPVVSATTQSGGESAFAKCMWALCPSSVEAKRRYWVDAKNARVAAQHNSGWCTIIGNAAFPAGKITSWNIKILSSKANDGYRIYVGVAPSGINQNEDFNFVKCGWYLCCWNSSLCSGPPHAYNNKEYGPRNLYGEYVQNGTMVCAAIDTAKGTLSFVLNGNAMGTAYEHIPLDKPLMPCVILGTESDAVELFI